MSLIKRLREHTSRQHLPVIVTSGHAGLLRHTQIGDDQGNIRMAGEVMQGEFHRRGGVADKALALQ